MWITCARTYYKQIIAGVLALLPLHAFAQRQIPAPIYPTFPAVMLSDLHFDPLHDPLKVPQLAKAPLDQWEAILNKTEAPGEEARYAALQKTCKAKDDMDSPYALLHSSLVAASVQSPSAAFVTVSGDLLVHDLDCRYRASMGLPAGTTDDQSISASFAEKTTVFVMQQVESAFPRVPVYFALGNNDSRCNHNRLDSHDAYLKASVSAVVNGLRGVSVDERSLAQATFESAGYYAVTMPAPMSKTRLIVIDDIYMMPKYTNCEADDKDHTGEQEQAAWLQNKLNKARINDQRVWILGHLPPTVNADSSLSDQASFCASGKVTRFQTTDDLANQFASYDDVIKLGVFGHTHMDELHLIRGKNAGVPIKVISSVSPVDGNLPSFTVGTIDRASATLANYTVYEASNKTGVNTVWSKEYSFIETYHESSFSPATLNDLIGRLRTDASGTGLESRAYQTHFLKGSGTSKLSSSWPGYVCSMDSATSKSFKACVCTTP